MDVGEYHAGTTTHIQPIYNEKKKMKKRKEYTPKFADLVERSGSGNKKKTMGIFETDSKIQ